MEVFSSNCFPSLSYLYALHHAKDPWIDVGEHYVKQSARNRFQILGPNGSLNVTARVKGQLGEKVPVHQIEVIDDEWRRLACKGIQAAYGSSAFFIHYYDEIEAMILDAKKLTDLSIGSTMFLIDQWALNQPQISETYIEEPGMIDLRSKKGTIPEKEFPEYPQVFGDRFSFVKGLSGLDLLMNLGPQGQTWLD